MINKEVLESILNRFYTTNDPKIKNELVAFLYSDIEDYVYSRYKFSNQIEDLVQEAFLALDYTIKNCNSLNAKQFLAFMFKSIRYYLCNYFLKISSQENILPPSLVCKINISNKIKQKMLSSSNNIDFSVLKEELSNKKLDSYSSKFILNSNIISVSDIVDTVSKNITVINDNNYLLDKRELLAELKTKLVAFIKTLSIKEVIILDERIFDKKSLAYTVDKIRKSGYSSSNSEVSIKEHYLRNKLQIMFNKIYNDLNKLNDDALNLASKLHLIDSGSEENDDDSEREFSFINRGNRHRLHSFRLPR